jgi:hypothetical protein
MKATLYTLDGCTKDVEMPEPISVRYRVTFSCSLRLNPPLQGTVIYSGYREYQYDALIQDENGTPKAIYREVYQ